MICPNHIRILLTASVVALASFAPSVAFAQMQSVLDRTPSRVVYEGLTEPRHTIMVAASEIGRLDSVSVKVGDQVVAGQVVATLDETLQQSAVRIATMQSLMTGERDAAMAEAELHQSRVENLRELAKNGMARPDELARAEMELRVSLARYATAEEQFQLRQLELQRYQIQLDRRKVRASMSGVISKILRKPGEYVSPSDPSVVQLLVVDKLIAVFNVPVEETPSVRVGSGARIFLRSSSTTIDATITSIAPDIEGESGTLQIRVELDNADGRLMAGDRCTLQFFMGGTSTAMRRPDSTLRMTNHANPQGAQR
ncbi:macrolide transporter subunit MacA [Rubripirellula tenax]|uniref:Macrolide transporter subunit MacA n=1 Tax=Rubripirellula tenax TaxID=2528015 RepID=A0A5C6FIL4_9BACT|nr:efflux RND transporter periplasmic adaptor subunit [Rubripirellula tenax]TWU59917.1 macrolide transporter subunit MacA [Rubripirellula tenax]